MNRAFSVSLSILSTLIFTSAAFAEEPELLPAPKAMPQAIAPAPAQPVLRSILETDPQPLPRPIPEPIAQSIPQQSFPAPAAEIPTWNEAAYGFLADLPPLPRQAVVWAKDTKAWVYTVKERKSERVIEQIAAHLKPENFEGWKVHRDRLRVLRQTKGICDVIGYVDYLMFYLETSSFPLRTESIISFSRCDLHVDQKVARVDVPVPSRAGFR